ncbi:MAG: DUF3187 family protein [Nitrospiraceae bacterium]|nr:MAG: DUF3187 family protein [Nitrospiraceae bacterium]
MSDRQAQGRRQGVEWPALSALLVVLLGLPVGADAAELYVGQGLVPVRNFQPLQGLSLQMPVDGAMPLKSGEISLRANVAETSTILRETTATGTALLKFGQLRSGFDIRFGTAMEDVEGGLEFASLYRHSSGLDGLVTAVESLVGRPAPLRQQLKKQGYAYSLGGGNTTLNPSNDAFGLTDIVAHVKTLLVAEGKYTPATSLRVALKVPVGDRTRAFGTGIADLGVGLSLQKTAWNRVGLYVNLNEMLPTGHYLGLALRGYFTAVTGVEFMATPKFSITGQFDYYQSPFGNTGLKLLDHGVTEAVLAFGYRFTPNLLWQIYGVENLDFIRDSAADFTLGTALTYRIPQK